MKRILPLFISFFSLYGFSQHEVSIYDSYLGEILSHQEMRVLPDFDLDDQGSREELVNKITTYSYADPSFLKANMVLNMLKYKLGDENYNEGIKAYLLQLGEDDTITVNNFKTSMEAVSGVDLTEFFNDWFTGKGYPTYEISWFQNGQTKTINIMVSQTQSDPSVSFFEMPLPVEVSNENGDSQIVRLEISEDKQTFTGYIPFNISKVIVDPEKQLITKNNIVKSGVDQEALNAAVTLFPNPAKNVINIQNSSGAVVEKISIFNMLGKLVLVEDHPLSAIDLKSLAFGIHLVKIETSLGTLHKTILKEQ